MAKEIKTTNNELLNEYGASWTKILWGFIQEEYNSDLTGIAKFKKYDEMRKSDAQIFATLLAMELPIRSTLWTIQPGTTEDENGDKITTDQDYIIANFVEKCLFEKMEITWDDFLRQVLTMLTFWFSLFEKVFKFEGDKIILKNLAQRLPRSVFKWETEDGKPGIQQILSTPSSNKTFYPSIPAEKLVRFTFRQEGDNYEGVSVLRSAYKHWYIKDTLYKLDAVKHERQSIWIPVLKIPKGATETDKNEAIEIMENLRSTEQTYIILPGNDWSFEFADLKAGTQSNMEQSIAHHNREISKNILAQFLELWAGTGWSYALSEDQSSLFLISLSAIAKQIAETLNRDVIKQLVDLNFTITENQTYPKLKFNKLWEVDYSKLSSSLSLLTWSWIIKPDDDLEDYVRTVFDLPRKLEEKNLDNETQEDLTDITPLEDTSMMEMSPEYMTQEQIDTEIIQMEQMMADLEANDLQTEDESINFKEVSQETRDKISQALIEYWRRKGKKTNDEVKLQRDKAIQDLQTSKDNIIKIQEDFKNKMQPMKMDIENLKSLRDSIVKGKAWKQQREILNQKIREIRTALKEMMRQKQQMMSSLQMMKSQAYKSRVEANKEIKARKAFFKQVIKQMREKINAGKMSVKQAIDRINARIETNNTQIQDLRRQIKEAWKDKEAIEILRILIDGIKEENWAYREEIKGIKEEFLNKKEDIKAKIEEVKKQIQFNEVWFLDEAEALAFQEARNVFNIYDILKIQNYGNR